MKYIITIVVRATGTVHNLERNEDTINSCINKELGGWDNLHAIKYFKEFAKLNNITTTR